MKDGPFNKSRSIRDVVGESSAQVVQSHDLVAGLQQVLSNVGSHETCTSGNERNRHFADPLVLKLIGN